MAYIHRAIETTLIRYLKRFPVVGIAGPRQSGKSTLVQHVLPHYTYVTFDSMRNVDFFEQDPEGFMQVYSGNVIFDEVQYVPNLFRFIKFIVDKNRKKSGQFVLTGSAQFSFLAQVSESLAGRIGIFSVLPLQFSEIPKKYRKQSIYLGSYPELISTQYREQALWYEAYLDTYFNKDLRTLANVGDVRDFRRFIYLLATNVTQTVDMTFYARDIGVAVSTIKRWLSVLEASYIIFLLPPFYRNLGKRIVKSPKIYFYDTGLVCALLGLNTKELYERGPKSGELFENYILSEIIKRERNEVPGTEFYYFRSSDRYEIDLIADKKGQQEFIEIKKTGTLKQSMLATLKQFKPENMDGVLIYNGKTEHFPSRIKVINYEEYLLS